MNARFLPFTLISNKSQKEFTILMGMVGIYDIAGIKGMIIEF